MAFLLRRVLELWASRFYLNWAWRTPSKKAPTQSISRNSRRQYLYSTINLFEVHSNDILPHICLQFLFNGQVSRVQFFGADGSEVIIFTNEGARLRVDGTPKESASSPLSPLKVVAKVRDAKVPYSFESFDLTSFRKVFFNVVHLERHAFLYKVYSFFQGLKKGEGLVMPEYLNPFEDIRKRWTIEFLMLVFF